MGSMYMNGQAQQQQQQQMIQDPMQHQYAVVKKTGSKRDIRENLERENSAIFKVKRETSLSTGLISLSGLSRARWHEFGMLRMLSVTQKSSSTLPPLAGTFN
jgi:hypothetical protein